MIRKSMPSAERLRFSNTGSEADRVRHSASQGLSARKLLLKLSEDGMALTLLLCIPSIFRSN